MRPVALLLLCLASATAATAFQQPLATPSPLIMRRMVQHRRAPSPLLNLGGDSDGSGSDSDSASSTAKASDSTSDTSSRSQATSSSSSDLSTSTQTSSSSSERQSSSSSSEATRSQATSSKAQETVASSVDTAGSVVQVTSTIAGSTSTAPPTSAASSSESAAPEEEDSGSNHTGLIIGVSVVGGVAILGALIFLYMKFGGKRFSDYQDDDADIKWPELKQGADAAAMQPLPARRTGGAGFDMGDESEVGHDDARSLNEYGNKGHDSFAGSTTALAPGVSPVNGYGGYDDANYQTGATGYFDPYGSGYQGGQENAYYSEQPQGYGNYNAPDYGVHDGYASHSTTTSPAMQPYRVGGQSMPSHF